MSEENIYQTPDANLVDNNNVGLDLAPTTINSLSAMEGISWIKNGFGLFKKSPMIWIALVILYTVMLIVVSIIPIIGSLAASLLYAVFVAGFMIGCAALENRENLKIAHLFAGFKKNTGPLIGLGGLYLLISVVLVIAIPVLIFGGAGGLEMLTDPESIDPATFLAPGILLSLLVSFALLIFALLIPVAMAFWFAPALISLGNQSLANSIKMSFSGCLKNILPFFIYGIAMMILAIIATIPLGLGWLVLMPVAIASIYSAYRAIFTASSLEPA
ncbi:MAG: hypothetical protein COC05_01640 [Gammaproteobacteria bacterium]|nr:MAG: hypothetical protein COC05_01640 [Gammaproteobacteria bacterium]